MIIKSLSASAYGAFDFCQHKFYLTYGLGYREPSNKKAEMGSIVHDVLECLALSKIHRTKSKFEHQRLGIIDNTILDIDDIIVRSYTHYVLSSEFDYDKSDLETCREWTYKVIEDELYDPRKLNVIDAEKYFDILITEDWAKYEHNGKIGYIGIRGYIDMITEPHPGVISVTDWKTGKRKDWNTGKVKTAEYIETDIQLLCYGYATQFLYPEAETILATLYYINDGGPFTINYTKEKKKYIETKLANRFHEIKSTQQPKLLSNDRSHFKCRKWCYFNKTKMPNTNISMCEFFQKQIKKEDLEITTSKYSKRKK